MNNEVLPAAGCTRPDASTVNDSSARVVVVSTAMIRRPVADMQRQRDPLDAACPQLVEHAVREVKSRRRGRHRPRLSCVHGLIAGAV